MKIESNINRMKYDVLLYKYNIFHLVYFFHVKIIIINFANSKFLFYN